MPDRSKGAKGEVGGGNKEIQQEDSESYSKVDHDDHFSI